MKKQKEREKKQHRERGGRRERKKKENNEIAATCEAHESTKEQQKGRGSGLLLSRSGCN